MKNREYRNIAKTMKTDWLKLCVAKPSAQMRARHVRIINDILKTRGNAA